MRRVAAAGNVIDEGLLGRRGVEAAHMRDGLVSHICDEVVAWLADPRKNLGVIAELADKVVDSEDEASSVAFAEGFGLITDLEVNPYDGYLYVVAPIKGESGKGSVYKLLPKSPDLISFPSGIETVQENQQHSLFPQLGNYGKCDELEIKSKSLWKDWEKGLLTDEQAIHLGDQTLQLMVDNKCDINQINS